MSAYLPKKEGLQINVHMNITTAFEKRSDFEYIDKASRPSGVPVLDVVERIRFALHVLEKQMRLNHHSCMRFGTTSRNDRTQSVYKPFSDACTRPWNVGISTWTQDLKCEKVCLTSWMITSIL